MPEELAKVSPATEDIAPESGVRAKTPADRVIETLKAAADERDRYRAETKEQAIEKVRAARAEAERQNRAKEEIGKTIDSINDSLDKEAEANRAAGKNSRERVDDPKISVGKGSLDPEEMEAVRRESRDRLGMNPKPKLELVEEDDAPEEKGEAPASIETREVDEKAFTPEEMSALAADVREGRDKNKRAEAVRLGIQDANLGLTDEEHKFFVEGDTHPAKRGMIETHGEWRKGEESVADLEGDIAKMEEDIAAMEETRRASKGWFSRLLDREGGMAVATQKAILKDKLRSLKRLKTKKADPKRYAEMTRLKNESRDRR